MNCKKQTGKSSEECNANGASLVSSIYGNVLEIEEPSSDCDFDRTLVVFNPNKAQKGTIRLVSNKQKKHKRLLF